MNRKRPGKDAESGDRGGVGSATEEASGGPGTSPAGGAAGGAAGTSSFGALAAAAAAAAPVSAAAERGAAEVARLGVEIADVEGRAARARDLAWVAGEVRPSPPPSLLALAFF